METRLPGWGGLCGRNSAGFPQICAIFQGASTFLSSSPTCPARQSGLHHPASQNGSKVCVPGGIAKDGSNVPIGDITPSSSINSTATEPTVAERMHRLAGGQTKKEKSPGGRAVRTRAQPTANLSSYLGSHSSASRRKGNVGWPSHPVAICTMCSAPIEDPRFINERCTRRVHGRRCKGTYEITMSPRDWKRCG